MSNQAETEQVWKCKGCGYIHHAEGYICNCRTPEWIPGTASFPKDEESGGRPYAETILVFAARYSHSRPTGGAGIVASHIKSSWLSLSQKTRIQLISESHDATENLYEWQSLREFANTKQEP